MKRIRKKRPQSFRRNSKQILISGVLFVHGKKGFGFVTPDHPEEYPFDIFIPARDLKGALDGDHVVVSLFPNSKEGEKRKESFTKSSLEAKLFL